jgi:hypothetical protein
MNPQLILNAAKAAYENREVAVKLLNKIKDWKDGPAEETGNEEKGLSLEERVALLEEDARQKSRIFKEQSELVAGLAENVAALSLTTQRLMKRMNMLTVLMVLSFILSVTALIVVLFV